MKNFDYLLQIDALRDLYNFCNAAEETQKSDYDNCGCNCRKALERLVLDIYQLKNIPVDKKDSLFKLSTGEPFMVLIAHDERLVMAMHYIRKVGNVAAHQGGITQKQAYFILLNTYNLVGGVLLRLGVLKTLAPFNKELPPKVPSMYVEPKDDPKDSKESMEGVVPEDNIKKPVDVPYTPDPNEAETRRMFIDLLLSEAGWEVLEKKNAPMAQKAGIEIEVGPLASTGGKGYCDYVLYGKDGMPLAVVEAKRTSVNEDKGREQAEEYADCLEKQYGIRPVIYYTNGYHTKIIDGIGYPPRLVMGFHKLEDLELLISRRNRQPLMELGVKDEITNRDYQKRAIRAVCDHFNDFHRHGLMVMATGTGKTRVAISLCEVLMRNGWVQNVLFLADRTSLVDQAADKFSEFLKNYTVCNLPELKDEADKKARIIISTYQTMINYIDSEEKDFSVGRFDLIILDEAHRSIFGKYTAIFDYFDSFLVGLTATPRNEVDRSTYELFHLDSNRPNFVYTQEEAEEEKHLVGYNPISRTTRRLREGIIYDSLTEEEREELDKAWEYEKAKAEEETGLPQQKTPRDIEKKEMFEFIYNIGTVDLVIQDLMANGQKIENGDKLGKTIIFAYDHPHAEMIVNRFYELYPKYDNSFCRLIDYSVKDPKTLILRFKDKNSYPQIAVSVDMLDTGIDVPEILNLVFFKPVYSSIKYIQMVGRGTRLCPGIFADGSDKKEFYIFDWCENFEYFKENKNGKEPLQTLSLTERLFELMMDIAVVLQHNKYQQDEFAKNLCSELKEKLFKQVLGLNETFVSVRKNWELVRQFKQKEAWVYISPLDALKLKKKIAPLIAEEVKDNGERMFDALMLNTELSLISPDITATRSKNKVMKIAQRLQTKASMPEVKKQMHIIEKVSDPKFWKSTSLNELEDVRIALRDLIRIIKGSVHERFFINISDTMEEKEGVERPEMKVDYHKRILDYLRDNSDNEVIKKIYNLQKLTQTDILELERICWEELGTKEEYDKDVARTQSICGDKVAAFIRSIIGVDRSIAKQMFSTFISENVLNSIQEEYLNQIIGYLCENGDITPATLFTDESFADYDWPSVFGENLLSIRKYIDELHGLIA